MTNYTHSSNSGYHTPESMPIIIKGSTKERLAKFCPLGKTLDFDEVINNLADVAEGKKRRTMLQLA